MTTTKPQTIDLRTDIDDDSLTVLHTVDDDRVLFTFAPDDDDALTFAIIRSDDTSLVVYYADVATTNSDAYDDVCADLPANVVDAAARLFDV